MNEIEKKIAKIDLKIMEILEDEFNCNRMESMGVIVPLKTEAKAQEMLDYLIQNKDDKDLMRIDRLLKTSISIAKS